MLHVDIGARRVAGALVRYVGSDIPTVVYTRVCAIDLHEGEEHSAAMLRALAALVAVLAEEGVSELVRAVRRHKIDSVLVSIDAPWQETAIHSERVVEEQEFVCTERMVSDLVANMSAPVAGKTYVDASVVGTILNGYEVHDPYGKRARNATFIILTSLIDDAVVAGVREAVHSLTRTKRVALIAGTSLRYQALRVVFRHEDNALILDATGPLPEVALVHNGFLVATAETPDGPAVSGQASTEDFMRGFADLAKQYPLPPTIFLLARFDEMEAMKAKLDAVKFNTLWLSDNPPRIIQLLTSHMTGLVRQLTTTPPDLPLLLMALYYRYLSERV